MATSGSFNTTSSDGRYLTFKWKEVGQSIVNNTTTISYEVVGAGNSGYVVCGKFKLNIDGQTVYSSSTRVKVYPGTLICSGELTLKHNSLGAKSFTAYLEAGIYYVAVNCSGTATYTLDAIPRASKPTLNTEPLTLGVQSQINTNAAVSTYTHDLYYKWGSGAWVLIAKGVYSYELWTPPLDLANSIPNATSGKGQIKCETRHNGQLLGTAYADFTAVVPDSVKPTGTVTVTDTRNALASFGWLVEGVSSLEVKIDAAATYGAEIAAYHTTASLQRSDSVTYRDIYTSDQFTTNVMPANGTLTMTTVITDSRGRKSDPIVNTYTVQDYEVPKINRFEVYRSDDAGREDPKGEYITLFINASVSTLQNKYSSRYDFKFKAHDDVGTVTSGTLSIRNGEAETGDFMIIRAASGNVSHDVTFTVTDRYNTVQKTALISTAFTLLNWGADGTSMGIGKVAEKENTVEIALTTETQGSLTQLGNHTTTSLAGTAGTAGYVHVATFAVKRPADVGTAAGDLAPIKMTLTRRGARAPMTLYLQIYAPYTNWSSIIFCEYEGEDYKPIINRRTDAVTYDLYVPKRIASDVISVNGWSMAKEMESIVKVTFVGDQVDEVPADTPFTPVKARLTSIVDLIYPVGSIYISANNINPGSLFGGTWTQLKDRFLLGAGSTYTAGATGGEATHTLTEAEMPAHSHTYQNHPMAFAERNTSGSNCIDPYNAGNTCAKVTHTTATTGNGAAHNNMPPYLVVYMWQRTA